MSRTVPINGMKVQSLRYKQRLTQAKLATIAGVSKRTIEDIESGARSESGDKRAQIYTSTLVGLCRALEVSERAIIDDDSDSLPSLQVSSGFGTSAAREDWPTHALTIPRHHNSAGSLIRGATTELRQSRLRSATSASSANQEFTHTIELWAPTSNANPIVGSASWCRTDADSTRWTIRVEFQPPESSQDLAWLKARKLCVEVCCGKNRVRLPIGRLRFDDEARVIVGSACVCLPEPPTEGAEVDTYDPDDLTDSTSRSVVSFPLVGGALPSSAHRDDLIRFARAVRSSQSTPQDLVPPDWFYHLAISRIRRFSISELKFPTDSDLHSLCERLHLDDPLSEESGFRLQPLELTSDYLDKGGDHPECVFPVPTFFAGKSHLLAVAVGLVAASLQTALPSWIAFSSGLDCRSLRLTRTGAILRKLRLALGATIHHEALNRLSEHVNSYVQKAHPELHLPNRTTAGKVRLFFTSGDLDSPIPALSQEFDIEPLAPISPDAFESMYSDDLKTYIDNLCGDRMLVVQASTLSSVLQALGLRPSRYLRVVADPSLIESTPLRAYAVSLPRTSTPVSMAASNIFRTEEYWGYLTRTQLALLDDELSHYSDPRERLKVILRSSIRAMTACRTNGDELCHAGDISLAEPNQNWLQVVATVGSSSEGMPYFLPADFGVLGQVIRSGRTAVIDNARQSMDLHITAANYAPLQTRYGSENVDRYLRFARTIGTCVKIPIKRGSVVIGVMCVHWPSARSTDQHEVQLLERIAERAAIELAFLLGIDSQSTPVQARPSRAVSAPDEATPKAGVEPLAMQLAEQAREYTKANRAAVRIIDWKSRILRTVAVSPIMAPLEEIEQMQLDNDPTANYAISCGRSYYIDDTYQTCAQDGDGNWAPTQYRPVLPDARAAAAILVRAGIRVLGVVSLYWNKPGAIPIGNRITLDTLVGIHAPLILQSVNDALHRRVEKILNATESTTECLDRIDYAELLQATASLVGASQGAVFTWDFERGRYLERANLCHGSRPEPQYYRIGEGVTGWILKYNRALCIKNLSNRSELAAIHPQDPPVWVDKVFDGDIREDGNWTYLGVPISFGGDVYGVLRFGHGLPEVGFSLDDQVNAALVASRIAERIHASVSAARTRALRTLGERVATSKDEAEAGEHLSDAIRTGIGKSTVSVRVLDDLERPAADKIEILRRVYASPECGRETAEYRSVSGSIAGDAIKRSEVLWIQDSPVDPRVAPFLRGPRPAAPEAIKYRSIITAPLISSGQCNGSVFVGREAAYAFRESDLEFVRDAGAVASSSFQRIMESKQVDVEAQLREVITAGMASILDWDVDSESPYKQVVSRLCQIIKDALKATVCGYWEFLPKRDRGEFVVGVGMDDGPNISKITTLLETGGRMSAFVMDPALDRRLSVFSAKLPKTGCDGHPRAVFIVADAIGLLGLVWTMYESASDVSGRRLEQLRESVSKNAGHLRLLGKPWDEGCQDARSLSRVRSVNRHESIGPAAIIRQ
jgi:GAF domain-containing protein/transcriptional regulator with XRE-family HTH domain